MSISEMPNSEYAAFNARCRDELGAAHKANTARTTLILAHIDAGGQDWTCPDIEWEDVAEVRRLWRETTNEEAALAADLEAIRVREINRMWP